MYAIDPESADQHGYDAPSVPASGCSTSPSVGRTYKRASPEPLFATITRRRPSGEMANRPDGSSPASSRTSVENTTDERTGTVPSPGTGLSLRGRLNESTATTTAAAAAIHA